MSNFYPKVKRTAAIFFVLSLIAWGFYISSVYAALITKEPFRDASVLRMEPEANFGGIKFLTVLEDQFSIGEGRSLIEFDLSSMPKSSKITSATLRLFVHNTENASQDIEIYRNTQRWKENSVTWQSKPAMAKEPSFKMAVLGVREDFIEIDVTDDVRGFVSGALKNYGWTILPANSGDGGVNFSSKDDASKEKKPNLFIRYSEKAGALSEEYMNNAGELFSSASGAAEISDEKEREAATDNGAMTENGQANSITAEQANESGGWTENVLMMMILLIFSMMFYVFWRKERGEIEI